MSQDPEEQPIVVRQVTPEAFCAASNRRRGGRGAGDDQLANVLQADGMKNDLAGVDADLAKRALDARQEPPLVIELDRPGGPHWLSREAPC